MKSIYISCILSLLLLLGSNIAFAVPAFDGAEGFGMYTVGGRGGQVIEVNNLNDSGPGSLRAAVEASGPRTVVFRVGGTISLLSTLTITNPYITIAGQTAPGDGICLKDYNFKIATDHVIIRYMRFRMGGNTLQEQDTVTIYKGQNIILDHLSASWSVDEVLSADCSTGHYAGNLTVQWCMITEGLNCSVHSKGCHGYGSLIRGGQNNKYTFHHNLYAHNSGRNPRPGNYVVGTTDPCGLTLDFRNNVIYNYGSNRAGNNDDGQNNVLSVTKMNFIGNYYKRGTNSTGNYAFKETTPTSRAYFSGNWHSGVGGYPVDPWTLVQFYNYTGFTWTPAQIAAYKLSSPVPVESVTTDTAVDAYSLVLADAGALFPVRDTVDTRVINEVITGTGSIIDDEDQVGGWPVLASGTPPVDNDHDGMPNAWEMAMCLDPNNASDANDYRSDGYTNIEAYINWLPSGEPMPTNTDINCDNIVNFYDFSEFARHWSASYGELLYSGRYDFSHNDEISMDDLFYIAQDWLTAGQEY